MAQVARNLTDAANGFLLPHRFLICDRDTKFTKQFVRILKDAGVDAVFVRTIKEECLNRMIVFGESSLHRIISQFVEHYHRRARTRVSTTWSSNGPVLGRHSGPRFGAKNALGGILRHYRRAA